MSSSIDQAAAAESQKFRESLGLGVEKKVDLKVVNPTVRQNFLRNTTTVSSLTKRFGEKLIARLMQPTNKFSRMPKSANT